MCSGSIGYHLVREEEGSNLEHFGGTNGCFIAWLWECRRMSWTSHNAVSGVFVQLKVINDVA